MPVLLTITFCYSPRPRVRSLDSQARAFILNVQYFGWKYDFSKPYLGLKLSVIVRQFATLYGFSANCFVKQIPPLKNLSSIIYLLSDVAILCELSGGCVVGVLPTEHSCVL